MKHRNVLVISDLHCPEEHTDAFSFIKYVAREMSFDPFVDLCVNIGDEITGHAWSYHEKDPSMPSADEELERAIKSLKPFYKLFPKCVVIESNHTSLAKRKAKTASIPSSWMKDYREALQAPKDWQWVPSLRINTYGSEVVNFYHGLKQNVFNEALVLGESLVQGHHHTKLHVRSEYVQALRKVVFGMQVGCLINDRSRDFDYNKKTAQRPALGCGVIIKGKPRIVPLLLSPQGRWLGRLF